MFKTGPMATHTHKYDGCRLLKQCHQKQQELNKCLCLIWEVGKQYISKVCLIIILFPFVAMFAHKVKRSEQIVLQHCAINVILAHQISISVVLSM